MSGTSNLTATVERGEPYGEAPQLGNLHIISEPALACKIANLIHKKIIPFELKISLTPKFKNVTY